MLEFLRMLDLALTTHGRRRVGLVKTATLALALTADATDVRGETLTRAAAAFAIAREPSAQATAARVQAALSLAVDAAPDFWRIEPARVTSGDPKTREEATLERARAAFADGRRAYDAMALDEAVLRLRQAVTLLPQAGPLLGDLSELVEAQYYLGAALVLRGSGSEAIRTFVDLLTIRPAYSPKHTVPIIQRTFERALTEVDAAPTGGAEIYSTPPYAAVYLDGRFEGVTPLTLSAVTAGTHYIRLEKVGHTVHGAPLSIVAGQQLTSQTRLLEIRRGAELRDLLSRGAPEVLQDRMGGALRELSRMLRSDIVFFVTVSQSGTTATLIGGAFDAATSARLGTERAVVRIDQDGFARDVGALATRLLNAGRTDPSLAPKSDAPFGLGRSEPGPASDPGARPPDDPYRDPLQDPFAVERGPRPTPTEVYLGWSLIGLGGASAAVGAGFGVSALLVHDDFRNTEQSSANLRDTRDAGKRNALLADILLFSGLGLAAGGTAILLFGSSREIPRAAVVPTRDGAAVAVGGNF